MFFYKLTFASRVDLNNFKRFLQPGSPGFRAAFRPAVDGGFRAAKSLQPRSRGCSLFGFSLFARDALQSVHRLADAMMLLLILNVLFHPWQILRAEGNDSVSRLPFQDLALTAELWIHLVRRGAFNLLNEIADQAGGRDVDGQFSSPRLEGEGLGVIRRPSCQRLSGTTTKCGKPRGS